MLDPLGTELSVNFDSGVGELRVEVQRPDGSTIPGFALADATPIRTNELDQPVAWGSRKALPPGAIRLRFAWNAGDLYGYAIQ